jgi:DNA-binding transcriptional MerR regulator
MGSLTKPQAEVAETVVSGSLPLSGDPRIQSVSDGRGQQAWKIDELARQSGTSVDTIRFYAREGLLPVAKRDGRGLSYGQAHLDRLKQIRQLQERHFTLAAIRDLAAEGRLELLERLFRPSEQTFTHDELVTRSGLDPDFVEELEKLGFVSPPEERGALAYDGGDLAALRSVKGLFDFGMPRAVVLLLAGIYIHQMDALRQELLACFGEPLNDLGPELRPDEIEAFVTAASTHIDGYLDHFEVVLAYLHRRTLERLTVEAVEVAQTID